MKRTSEERNENDFILNVINYNKVMIEIIINGDSNKFIEIETYKGDLLLLKNKSKLEIMIYALEKLSKSENNTLGNPYFNQVNTIKAQLLSIKENVEI
jgi:hypothetical protein